MKKLNMTRSNLAAWVSAVLHSWHYTKKSDWEKYNFMAIWYWSLQDPYLKLCKKQKKGYFILASVLKLGEKI